jgi:hypothetical protein
MSNLFARWESIPQSYLAPSLYVADIAQYRRRCCGGPAVLSSNCEMMRNQLYRTKRGEAWCEIRRLHSEPFGSSVGAPSSPSFFLEAYITVHESRHTHANFNTIPYSGPKDTCQISQTQRDRTTPRLHLVSILHHHRESCPCLLYSCRTWTYYISQALELRLVEPPAEYSSRKSQVSPSMLVVIPWHMVPFFNLNKGISLRICVLKGKKRSLFSSVDGCSTICRIGTH